MKYLSVYLILLIVFSSCKKKYVVEISPEYEGEWHSAPVVSPTTGVGYEEYFIIVDGQGVAGGCNSTLVDTNCFQHFNGDALFNWNKSKFCIGKTFEGAGSIIFHIDKPPHINSDGIWECTLTGRVYIKR